ncbi:hypothetical protein K6Y31_11255 [Motilimonas cestriensis]|uniref:Uncharacterized protein n=1 Tax=Motilimonas cestriensis TaxID=2742685 RepID=A0ABS8WA48_9GAMM|nr:hypothetical protein [Motilimonas cestriensis]MCE2595393.1 hypothetical protein [Motilimonas cestriensis]
MSQKKVSAEELALWIEQVHNSSCCSDIANQECKQEQPKTEQQDNHE